MDEKNIFSILAKNYLLWIILLAVIVRVGLMLMLQSWEFDGSRTYGHRAGEIGSALASGQGFSWPVNSTYVPENAIKKTSWEAPVYPFIFAAVFKVFGIYSHASAVVLILFQTLLAALCCWLIFSIGKHIFNEGTGLIGGFMFALYPAGLHFGVQKIQTTYLIVALLLVFILQLYGLSKSPAIGKSLLTGITFGIAILTEPTLISFFPFALIWLIFRARGTYRPRVISVAFIVLAVAITNLPWQLRNYNVFGEFFLIKSNFSRELFMGNYADETSNEEERKLMATLDEGKRNKVYLHKAIDAILSNPANLVNYTVDRFRLYWIATPRKNIYGKTANMAEKVLAISYLSVFVSFVVGIYLAARNRKEIQPLLLAVIFLPIPYYITWFARFRYRFPVEVIMIIIGSFTVYSLWDFLYKQTRTNS